MPTWPEAPGCPPDALLAARATHSLGVAELASIDLHVAGCESCRIVLSELMRASGSRPETPRLGRYVLTEMLGAGGMGTVWSALDPELGRHVAVKVLHDAHALDPARSQRFLAERQILAALVHPNIARLLDAGASTDGRAWFAMEQVDGLPIDVWCQQRELPLRARLELMLPVCSAVSHAHAHLVVHRDLKPNNILVTHEGVPKLVDFGIAKLLLDDASVTQTGVVPMTPAFAAPEQVRSESVTTATDVYSLGVVLYELTTGRSPYGVARGDVAALLAAVRDTEPSPPGLDADLDAILLMALRKDPRDRYASPQALADDLRALLDGRPTAARKGSRAYRALKFARRHKTPVTAAAVAVLALVAGLIATLWQAREAELERDVAQQRFQELRSLAHSVVFDYHDGIASLPGSTPLRERLVSDALKYLHSLAASAVGDIGLQNELAQALLKIGDVQGDPFASSLGHTAQARAAYSEAQVLALTVLRADPANREALRTVAQSHEKLGALLEIGGQLEEAVAAYQTARALYARLLATDPNDIAAEHAIGLQDIASGQVNTQRGKLDEAEVQLRRAIALREGVVKRTHDPEHRRGLTAGWYSLSRLMHERMKNDEELALLKRAESELADLVREHPDSLRFRRDLNTTRTSRAQALMVVGRGPEAIELMKTTLDDAEASLAKDPQNAVARRDATVALSTLGDVYKSMNQPTNAIAPLERALELNARLGADDAENAQVQQDRVFLHLNLARAQDDANLVDAAASHCRQALEVTQALQKSGVQDMNERVADCWRCFLDLYSERRPQDAIEPGTKALAILEHEYAVEQSSRLLTNVAAVSVQVGQALAQLKRWEPACERFDRAVDAFAALKKEGAIVGSMIEHHEQALAGQKQCREAR